MLIHFRKNRRVACYDPNTLAPTGRMPLLILLHHLQLILHEISRVYFVTLDGKCIKYNYGC